MGAFSVVFGILLKRIKFDDLCDIFLIYRHATYLATFSFTYVFIYLLTQPHTYLFIYLSSIYVIFNILTSVPTDLPTYLPTSYIPTY